MWRGTQIFLSFGLLILSCTNSDPIPPTEYKVSVRYLETLQAVPGIPLRLRVFKFTGVVKGKTLITTDLLKLDGVSGVDGSYLFSVPSGYMETGARVHITELTDSLIAGSDRYEPCPRGLSFYFDGREGSLYVDPPTYLEVTATREPSSTNTLFVFNNSCRDVVTIERDTAFVVEQFYSIMKNQGLLNYNLMAPDGAQTFFTVDDLTYQKRDTTRIQIIF